MSAGALREAPPHALRPSSAVGTAFVPSLLAIGLVVSVISSLGAPLIPTIARELGTSIPAAQWCLTIALIVGAVASPVIGRLGDGRHRRTVLLICLSLVTLGGVAAALARTLAVLLLGRALQGLGLALLPLTMAAAREHLPAESAGRTIALLSVISAAGTGLGYPITGFIAAHLDTSAAFWFGAAASGATLLLALAFIPPPASSPHYVRLDIRGACLIGASLVALLLDMERGSDWGWASPATLGLLMLALVLFGLWTVNELSVAQPLIDLRLVRRRPVLGANATGLVLGCAMYLALSLMTQVVQEPTGFGDSVFVAGLTLLPLSLLSLISSRIAPILARRLGLRLTIPFGALLIAAALLLFAITGNALWQAFVVMGIVGIGLGMTFAALPGLIVRSVPREETSSATSFYQVTRYIGFSIGSGLSVTILRALDGGSAVPTTNAYAWTFAIGAGVCALAALLAWSVTGPTAEVGLADSEARTRAVEEGELSAAGLPGVVEP